MTTRAMRGQDSSGDLLRELAATSPEEVPQGRALGGLRSADHEHWIVASPGAREAREVATPIGIGVDRARRGAMKESSFLFLSERRS